MPLTPLAEFISTNYEPQVVVEVGIGNKWDIAIQLSSTGFKVIATDIMDLDPLDHGDFDFVKDDITDPHMRIYYDAGLIYSIRPPPDIFSSIINVARYSGADCLIRPLGNEFPQGGELINYKGERFYLWRFGRKYGKEKELHEA